MDITRGRGEREVASQMVEGWSRDRLRYSRFRDGMVCNLQKQKLNLGFLSVNIPLVT